MRDAAATQNNWLKSTLLVWASFYLVVWKKPWLVFVLRVYETKWWYSVVGYFKIHHHSRDTGTMHKVPYSMRRWCKWVAKWEEIRSSQTHYVTKVAIIIGRVSILGYQTKLGLSPITTARWSTIERENGNPNHEHDMSWTIINGESHYVVNPKHDRQRAYANGVISIRTWRKSLEACKQATTRPGCI